MSALQSQPRVVVVVLFPGVRLFDVAGPIEIFTVAHELGADYQILTASPGGGSVGTTDGLARGTDVAWTGVVEPINILVVPGSPD
jgi:transcriptional regulator GlxA family with amidase domain